MELGFLSRRRKARDHVRLPEGCVGRSSVAEGENENLEGHRKLEVALICAGQILRQKRYAYEAEAKSPEAVNIALDAAEIDFGMLCEQCPYNPNRQAADSAIIGEDKAA